MIRIKKNNTPHNNALDGQTCYRSVRRQCWPLGATLKDETTDVQNANPAQNKKSCKPTHKPTQIAAHFIFPTSPKPTSVY